MSPLAIPFGDPRHLMNRKMAFVPTRQDVAIVICGGGKPFAEAERAFDLVKCYGRDYEVLVGNDMIAKFGGPVDHACTLHPDKLSMWIGERRTNEYPAPGRIWSHRPFTNVTDWTRDWNGSTGLFCVKVARELGFTHVILCGVHMSPDSNHFVRGARWDACDGFLNGWRMRLPVLRPYVRSFGGWTREQFGLPTPQWLDDIEDQHREPAPPGFLNKGLKA